MAVLPPVVRKAEAEGVEDTRCQCYGFDGETGAVEEALDGESAGLVACNVGGHETGEVRGWSYGGIDVSILCSVCVRLDAVNADVI